MYHNDYVFWWNVKGFSRNGEFPMETHGFEGTSTHKHCQLVVLHMMNLEPNDHATHDIVSHWDVPGPWQND